METQEVKMAIVGSRTFNDYDLLKAKIEEIVKDNPEIFVGKKLQIVSGGARGADALGERYAKENGYKTIIFKADWNKYGKSAGFRRNVDIIKTCDACIAFWDGESHGTKHDIDLCGQYNKPCFICYF